MAFYGAGDLIMNGSDQKAFDLSFQGTGVLRLEGSDQVAERIYGDIVADTAFALVLTDCVGSLDAATCNDITVTRQRSDGVTVVFDGCTDVDLDMTSDNSSGTSLTLTGCTTVDATVRIGLADHHGVLVDGGNDIVISGRVAGSSQATANTYDNVHMTGTTTCRVSSFTSRGATGKTRYGTNVDALCSDNILDQIDYGDSTDYATAIAVDAGTNTRTGTNWNT